MAKFPIGAALALLAATQALSAEPHPSAATLSAIASPAHLGIAYTISFWGIPFGHTNYNGQFADDQYSVDSHFETSGIVSLFWQAIIDATAHGKIASHALTPSEYDSYYRRGGDKKERVKVTFAADGPVTLADPPYDTTRFPVTSEQKRDAVDPMSAIAFVLAGVTADAANPCGTVVPVFDGRRRYDIAFTYLKDEPLKLGNGMFDGKAHLCQLHYNQIAGFKPKILKEGQAFPPIFADFADIPNANAPNGHYVVALRVSSRTGWGTVSAELTQLNLNRAATKD